MSKEYDILFAKYNSVVARNQDLSRQIETKEKQWSQREVDFKTTEKIMRELCEQILATNPEEMKLGKAGSWGDVKINDLIRRTVTAYQEYRKKINEILKKNIDELDKRRQLIEDKDDQLTRVLQEGAVSKEELERQIHEEKERKKSIENLPPNMKKNVDKIQFVHEEDKDIVNEEEDLYGDIDDIKLTPASIPATPAKRTQKIKKAARQKAEQKRSQTQTVLIDDYEKEITAVGWKILEAISETGFSVYQDIHDEVIKRAPETTDSSIRTNIKLMASSGVLNQESITNPLKKQLMLYELSVMGERICVNKFKKEPVPSEMSIIAKEHSNYIHGYGIKLLADAIREGGEFEKVIDHTRKHPFKLANGSEYIPDIICEDSNGKKLFFEYECGNTTQTDFNGKCSKMSAVTDCLNFIGPNKAVTSNLMEQCKKWINARGAKALQHITIRIASADQIKNSTSIRKNASWRFVFQPGKKGDEPITNN